MDFSPMATGVIKKLTDRFYGFIAVDGEGNDIFFHGSEVEGARFEELREGDAVTFEIKEGEKGKFASGIKRNA